MGKRKKTLAIIIEEITAKQTEVKDSMARAKKNGKKCDQDYYVGQYSAYGSTLHILHEHLEDGRK